MLDVVILRRCMGQGAMPSSSLQTGVPNPRHEKSKGGSRSNKHEITKHQSVPPRQRERSPPLGPLGYLVAGMQKFLHICIHCRGTWQLTLTASLALYYFQSEVLLDDLFESSSLSAAARNCTYSCGLLCALPASAFIPNMYMGVAYRDVTPPPSNRKRYARDGAVGVASVRLKTHPSASWWINPRQNLTYCQWSWTQSLYDDPLSGPNLQYMADAYLGTAHQRRWMDYPGKYYNASWDEVQDWLSLEHDPILLLHLRYRQIIYRGGQSVKGYAIVALLVVIYTMYRVRRARYGSLYYVLLLDSLMAVGARSAVRVRLVAFVTLCMALSVAFTLFYSKASVMLYVKFVATYAILGMSFYSLINQASPVGPSLRSSAKRNEPTALPCMRWWHTSELTVSQVFAVFLLSERRLAQVKAHNKFALLQRHINTDMLECVPLQELQRIKAIWQLDEQLAKCSKTRKTSISAPPGLVHEDNKLNRSHASYSKPEDCMSLTAMMKKAMDEDVLSSATGPGTTSTDAKTVTKQLSPEGRRQTHRRGRVDSESEGSVRDSSLSFGTRRQSQSGGSMGDDVTVFAMLPPGNNASQGEMGVELPRPTLPANAATHMVPEAWTAEFNGTSSAPLAPGLPSSDANSLPISPPCPQSQHKSKDSIGSGGQLSPVAKQVDRATPEKSQHVNSYRDRMYVLGNTLMGMSQYWILTASMLLTCNKLLTLLIKYSVGVAFVTKCTCSCGIGEQTIEQCYKNEMAKKQSAWMHLLWPMLFPLLVVLGCLLWKLYFDLQRVSGTRYGTLEYVIQCELRKRTRSNRVLAVVTTVCTLCITASLLVVTYLQAAKFQQEAQLYAFLVDVMQQLVAGFTMCTETGYLTPLAQRDVPDIVLPFRWWDSGHTLMCLAALSNDEIGRLKDATPRHVRSHGLPRRFVAHLSVYHMLRIKHHLRRQDVMNPFRISVEDKVLPTINALSALLNKTVALGMTTNTLRVAPAPEDSTDDLMMTDILEEEDDENTDEELFLLSQTFSQHTRVSGEELA